MKHVIPIYPHRKNNPKTEEICRSQLLKKGKKVEEGCDTWIQNERKRPFRRNPSPGRTHTLQLETSKHAHSETPQVTSDWSSGDGLRSGLTSTHQVLGHVQGTLCHTHTHTRAPPCTLHLLIINISAETNEFIFKKPRRGAVKM